MVFHIMKLKSFLKRGKALLIISQLFGRYNILLGMTVLLPNGTVYAEMNRYETTSTEAPVVSSIFTSIQVPVWRQVTIEQEPLLLRRGSPHMEQVKNTPPTTPSDVPSQAQKRDAKLNTEGVPATGINLAEEENPYVPSVSGARVEDTESPVAPQTPGPEIQSTPAKEPVSSSSSGVASVKAVPAVSGEASDDAKSPATPQNPAPSTTAVPAEVSVESPRPVADVPVKPAAIVPGKHADGTEYPATVQTREAAEIPAAHPPFELAPASTVPAARGQTTDCAGPTVIPQLAVAPAEASVSPPVQEQPDETPQKTTLAENAPAASGAPVDGAEVVATPRTSVPTSETPALSAGVPVTPVLRTTSTDKTPSPAPAEKVVPRTLSEQEQNSYVVGMMVADYARSVLLTLDKLDVSPDERLFREGLQDALSGKPELDSVVAQAAMQRIQKQADRRQAELDAASRQALVEIAGKHNTVEKKEDRIWVRLKKGGPAVSKQTPLSLSWEGQFYNGAVFESVTDAAVTRREVLPSWLQRAIRLAGPGGEVRLFILAGSLEGEAPLPAGTGRHELVQYTVSVKKG